MKRVILIVLDSVGIGYANDAKEFGDVGANTLGNIAKKFPNIKIPNLISLGLAKALESASGINVLDTKVIPRGYYGFAQEVSKGKDTISGHWEIAGCPVPFEWGYFRDKQNTFPKLLLQEIINETKIEGILGNCHASGTQIIESLGEQHLKTKQPICYTSADSVFQIAAHETVFGLENLYKLCEIIREKVYKYNIGRVIARPFLGSNKKDFYRTVNRRDYAIKPPKDTVLDKMLKKGGEVIAIGKISDIFAGQGISKSIKATGISDIFNQTLNQVKNNQIFSIIFPNFVNFDSDFGHRRNVLGYKEALEYFDKQLPEILTQLQTEDLLIITADHGCDPTFKGTDHTREYIPIMVYNKHLASKSLGKLETYSDIGQSIAKYLGLEATASGNSFL